MSNPIALFLAGATSLALVGTGLAAIHDALAAKLWPARRRRRYVMGGLILAGLGMLASMHAVRMLA